MRETSGESTESPLRTWFWHWGAPLGTLTVCLIVVILVLDGVGWVD
jgi:hypothetical protein